MFKRFPKTLTANLATSGTLKLGVLDKVALRDSGHRLFANGVRYNANTDFTIAANPDTGEGTLTWLNATTLTSGSIILVAIAFIDSITSSDGSGGGGGTVTIGAGSALIGKVGIDQTTPGTTNGVVLKDGSGAVIDQTATVNVAQDTAAIKNGATSLTPKFAAIAASASGDNPIVAVVAGKKIRVLSYVLMANGAVNAKWRSATTDKSGLLYFAANGGAVAPHTPVGHLETAAGEALNLNLSGAVAVGGHVTYIEV